MIIVVIGISSIYSGWLLLLNIIILLLFLLIHNLLQYFYNICILSLASCSVCIKIIPSSAKNSVIILHIFVLIPFKADTGLKFFFFKNVLFIDIITSKDWLLLL